MTKNEFKQLARKRGITSARYSGKKRIMFIDGTAEILSAFFSFIRLYELNFTVKAQERSFGSV